MNRLGKWLAGAMIIGMCSGAWATGPADLQNYWYHVSPDAPESAWSSFELLIPYARQDFYSMREIIDAWTDMAAWQTTFENMLAGETDGPEGREAVYPDDVIEALQEALEDNNFNAYLQAYQEWFEREGWFLAVRSPQNATVQTQRSVVQNTIFQPAEPERSGEAKDGQGGGAKPGTVKLGGADISADFWRYDDGGGKGKTFGVTPTFTVGETSQFTLGIPMYQTDIWQVDKEILTYGLDGRFKQKVTDNIAVGVHGNFLQTHYGTARTDKREGTVTAGPFVACNVPLTDRLNLSFGGMVDYTNPEWSNDFWTGAAGANLGIKLLDNLVMNPYFIYFRSLDRAIEGVDNDFWDVGTELKALLGESWTVSLGFRTTMGYVNFKSYGVYLGTAWQF